MNRSRWALLGFAALAVAIVLLLTGCGADGDGTRSPRDAVLVEYRVSGGFIGLADRLVVRTDGDAILTSSGGSKGRVEFELNGTQMNDLREALEAARAADLEPSYELDNGVIVADGIQYEIAFDGSTVTVGNDGASPQALVPLHSVLFDIVMSHR